MLSAITREALNKVKTGKQNAQKSTSSLQSHSPLLDRQRTIARYQTFFVLMAGAPPGSFKPGRQPVTTQLTGCDVFRLKTLVTFYNSKLNLLTIGQ